MTRSFYLDAEIDGYANHLSGGPRRKEDGFEVTFLQYDSSNRNSDRRKLFRVVSSTRKEEGKLILTTAIYDIDSGELIKKYVTEGKLK